MTRNYQSLSLFNRRLKLALTAELPLKTLPQRHYRDSPAKQTASVVFQESPIVRGS